MDAVEVLASVDVGGGAGLSPTATALLLAAIVLTGLPGQALADEPEDLGSALAYVADQSLRLTAARFVLPNPDNRLTVQVRQEVRSHYRDMTRHSTRAFVASLQGGVRLFLGREDAARERLDEAEERLGQAWVSVETGLRTLGEGLYGTGRVAVDAGPIVIGPLADEVSWQPPTGGFLPLPPWLADVLDLCVGSDGSDPVATGRLEDIPGSVLIDNPIFADSVVMGPHGPEVRGLMVHHGSSVLVNGGQILVDTVIHGDSASLGNFTPGGPFGGGFAGCVGCDGPCDACMPSGRVDCDLPLRRPSEIPLRETWDAFSGLGLLPDFERPDPLDDDTPSFCDDEWTCTTHPERLCDPDGNEVDFPEPACGAQEVRFSPGCSVTNCDPDPYDTRWVAVGGSWILRDPGLLYGQLLRGQPGANTPPRPRYCDRIVGDGPESLPPECRPTVGEPGKNWDVLMQMLCNRSTISCENFVDGEGASSYAFCTANGCMSCTSASYLCHPAPLLMPDPLGPYISDNGVDDGSPPDDCGCPPQGDDFYQCINGQCSAVSDGMDFEATPGGALDGASNEAQQAGAVPFDPDSPYTTRSNGRGSSSGAIGDLIDAARDGIGDAAEKAEEAARGGGDPVILASGRLSHWELDLRTPGEARRPVKLHRFYLSGSGQAGTLGRGWVHQYEERLIPVTNRTWASSFPKACVDELPRVTCWFHLDPGGGGLYLWDAQRGVFVGEPGTPGVVTAPSVRGGSDCDGTLVMEMRSPRGVITEFSMRGEPLRRVFPNGDQQAYLYGANGLLAGVTDERGDALEFRYDQFGLLRQVEDSLGRVVEYCYDWMIGEDEEVHEPTVEVSCNDVAVSAGFSLEEAVELVTGQGGGVERVPLPARFGGEEPVARTPGLARLREVRALPVREGSLVTDTSDGDAPWLSRRYHYAGHPFTRAFREHVRDWAVVAHEELAAEDIHGPPQDGCIPLAPPTLAERRQEQIFALLQEVIRHETALTAIERRVSPLEEEMGMVDHHAAPAPGEVTVPWRVELANCYEWEARTDEDGELTDNRSIGRVVNQAWGSRVSIDGLPGASGPPASSFACASEMPIAEENQLAEFSFLYHDGHHAPGLPQDITAALDAEGVSVALGSCETQREDLLRYRSLLSRTTVFGWTSIDSGVAGNTPREPTWRFLRSVRTARADYLNVACTATRTVDRGGVHRMSVLNLRGQALLEATRVGASAWRTDVVRTYDGDGRVVREKDASGRVLEYTWDNGLLNPLATLNLLQLTEHPGDGTPSVGDGPLPSPASRTMAMRWEPVTNALRWQVDFRGGQREILYGYQLDAQRLDRATEEMGRFGVLPEVFDGLPIAPGNTPSSPGAFPLPVRISEPARALPGGGSFRPERVIVYNEWGLPLSIRDLRDSEPSIRFEYGDLIDPDRCGRGECCTSPNRGECRPHRQGLWPLLRFGSGGGPLQARESIVDQSAGLLANDADGLDGAALPRLATTRQQMVYDDAGRLEAIVLPDGSSESFGFDGYGRMVTRVTPRDLVVASSYATDGTVLRVEESGDDGTGIVTRAATVWFRDGEGRVMATCRELIAGVCRAPLPALAGAGPNDNFQLTLYGYDGEGRLAQTRMVDGSAVLYHRRLDGEVVRVSRMAGSGTDAEPSTPVPDTVVELDVFGRTLSTAIVPAGQPASHAEALVTRAAWDGLGRMVEVRHPTGVVQRRDLDAGGLPWRIGRYAADGTLTAEAEMVYDMAGLLQRETVAVLGEHRHERVTRFAHDHFQRVLTIEHPDGRTERHFRASNGSVAHSLDGMGNEQWSLSAVIGSELVTRTRQRTAEGTAATVDRASQTRMDVGQGTIVSNKVWAGQVGGSTSTTRLDAWGAPVWHEDPRGVVSEVVRDLLGRTVQEVRSQLPGQSSASPDVVVHEWDSANRRIRLIDTEGRSTEWSWDGFGRLRAERVPAADGSGHQQSARSWDALGRLARLEHADGTQSEFAWWTGTSLLDRRVDPGGVEERWSWDDAARPSSVVRRESGWRVETSFERFPDGRAYRECTRSDRNHFSVPWSVQPLCAERSWDELGRQTGSATLGVDLEWSYDAVGRQADTLATLLGEEHFARYGWEGHRLVATTLYRAAGQGANAWRQETRSHDAAGFLTGLEHSFPESGSLAWRHVAHERQLDAQGRILSDWLGERDGSATTGRWRVPRYDAREHLSAVVENLQTSAPLQTFASADAAWSSASSRTGSSSIEWERSRFGTVLGEDVDGDTVWSAARADDGVALGLVADERSGHIASPTWDTRGRMRRDGAGLNYEWSVAGDRLLRAWRNGEPGDDRDPCENGCLVPFGLDVDENGSANFSNGGEDEDGGFRPTLPRLAPAWHEERVTDAFGRVVRIVYELEGPFGMAWSVSVQRVWDGPRLLHERTSSGCLQRVWAPGVLLDRPLAYAVSLEPACMEKFDDPQEEMEALFAMMAEGSAMELDLSIFDDEDVRVFTLLQDLRQDVVAVLDEEGEVVEQYRYDVHGLRWAEYEDGSGCDPFEETGSWGEVPGQRQPSATSTCLSRVGNPLGWQGSRLSQVTGAYDMRARHYDPRLRVFISRDPLGYIDSFDTWLYASGDPLGMWDPWGMQGIPTETTWEDLVSSYGEERAFAVLFMVEARNFQERLDYTARVLFEAPQITTSYYQMEGAFGMRYTPERYVPERFRQLEQSCAQNFRQGCGALERALLVQRRRLPPQVEGRYNLILRTVTINPRFFDDETIIHESGHGTDHRLGAGGPSPYDLDDDELLRQIDREHRLRQERRLYWSELNIPAEPEAALTAPLPERRGPQRARPCELGASPQTCAQDHQSYYGTDFPRELPSEYLVQAGIGEEERAEFIEDLVGEPAASGLREMRQHMFGPPLAGKQ